VVHYPLIMTTTLSVLPSSALHHFNYRTLHRMEGATSTAPKIATRPTFSCIRCAERKVKCDRQKPCGACVKHNVDCNFHASKPPRKKAKRVKVQVLADRLNQYEALLQRHGIDRSELPDSGNHEMPSRPNYAHAVDSEAAHAYTTSAPEAIPDRNSDISPSQHDPMHLRIVEK
jgi:hypothetical protein